jgi:hypothetical protein
VSNCAALSETPQSVIAMISHEIYLIRRVKGSSFISAGFMNKKREQPRKEAFVMDRITMDKLKKNKQIHSINGVASFETAFPLKPGQCACIQALDFSAQT